MGRLPELYLINGPLGAGKTSLLSYLLGLEQFRGARVIENEFANTAVDSEQLAKHKAEIQTLAGVCICCATGNELFTTLEHLAETATTPVIVEATGVANSLVLIERLTAADLLSYYTLRQAFFVLDALETLHHPELVDRHKEELIAADTVLLSKTDLLDPEAVMELLWRLEALRGSAPVDTMLHGAIDTSILSRPSTLIRHHQTHRHTAREHEGEPSYLIVSAASRDVSPAALEAAWPLLVSMYGAERLKGTVTYQGSRWHIEATPSRCQITHEVISNATLHLVIIGSDVSSLSEEIVLTLIDSVTP